MKFVAFIVSACVLMLALVAVWSSPVAAQSGGFVVEPVVLGLSQPVDFAFAPDGRIFIAELRGRIRVFKNGGLLATPFVTLPVNQFSERGLLGLALDPDFALNGFVYAFYTAESTPDNPQGPKGSRVVRMKADGDVMQPGSEVVILGTVVPTPAQPSCQYFGTNADCLPVDDGSHAGGALRFAPDGTLFVSTGDGVLSGTNAAGSARAQNLDSLAGKVLRIQRDGLAPSDNPYFTGNPSDNRSKVWAMGFRNPFRLGMAPGAMLPLVGDVGYDEWEEINAAMPGGNFGWPCVEGFGIPPFYTSLPECQWLYANPGQISHAIYAYPHEPGFGGAITAGVVYFGTEYPAAQQNALFFGDYALGRIQSVQFDSALTPIPGTFTTVLPDADSPVDFEIGPEGRVYFVSLVSGSINRLDYITGNRSPNAQASASPGAGLPPLVVQFSSAGSSDPEGAALTYSWDFGDGATSTVTNPSHTYTAAGVYTATLTVHDPELASGSTSVSIVAGNQPPVGTILAPHPGAIVVPGSAVTFAGSGWDPELGDLPASALNWTISLHHCESSGHCHTHPILESAGAGGQFVVPDHGDPGTDIYYSEVALAATDASGLTTSTSTLIGPDSDGDLCMDAFSAQSTYSPPYGIGETAFTPLGNGSPYHEEWSSVIEGRMGSFASYTAMGGTQGSISLSTILRDSFHVAQSGPYVLSFGHTLEGLLYAATGAYVAGTDVGLAGLIVDATTGEIVAARVLRSEELYSVTGLNEQWRMLDAQLQQAPLSAMLTAGDYWWVLAAFSGTGGSAAPDNATVAYNGMLMTLEGVTLCHATAAIAGDFQPTTAITNPIPSAPLTPEGLTLATPEWPTLAESSVVFGASSIDRQAEETVRAWIDETRMRLLEQEMETLYIPLLLR